MPTKNERFIKINGARNYHYNILNKRNDNQYSFDVKLIISVVYMALLMDNMLLTIIVPILPGFIPSINNGSISLSENLNLMKTILPQLQMSVEKERITCNGNISTTTSVGPILATKAFFQLIFNPIVGNISNKFGCSSSIFVGTFCLLISSLVLGLGESFFTLLLARAIHGIGSALITVCGMSLMAQVCPKGERRSKLMGITLGSMALGVLLGYPFGSILYEFQGKSTPFLVLSVAISITLGMQLIIISTGTIPLRTIQNCAQPASNFKTFLRNKMILALVMAIWFSTSTVAILEPLLPIWLIQHLKPSKWQLGTVFIPDSLGYFIGTNFLGSLAHNYGQIKLACLSLVLVGTSSILIPLANSMNDLLLPHFGLGLGVGIIDAALVPLMATLADNTIIPEENLDEAEIKESINVTQSYGTLYAIQQTPVSVAYLLAPLIGDEMERSFGFAWVMWVIGFSNILYGPILAYLNYMYGFKSPRRNGLPHDNNYQELNNDLIEWTYQYPKTKVNVNVKE